MEDNETIIPPVRAGERTEELEIEYKHTPKGEGSFEARGVHSWTFDHSAYHSLTGLDEGANYPYIPQANGHTLSLVTDYTWMHSTCGDEDSYTLNIEQSAVRGTYSYEYYFTRGGYYDLNEDMEVVRTGQERQPYRQREAEKDIPHNSLYMLDGLTVESGEEFVRGLHSGRFGPSIEEQLHDLIVLDSPDDALTPEEYERVEASRTVAAGD